MANAFPSAGVRKGERGIWQRRYWEHVIRNERDLHHHLDYIHYRGEFEKAPNWQSFAVRDGNLITGQNPNSSVQVAQHVLAALNGVQAKLAA